MSPFAALQDGKYDRLLRLLYDDIEKYETQVTSIPTDLPSLLLLTYHPFQYQLHALHWHCACSLKSSLYACDMCFSNACICHECTINKHASSTILSIMKQLFIAIHKLSKADVAALHGQRCQHGKLQAMQFLFSAVRASSLRGPFNQFNPFAFAVFRTHYTLHI